MTQAALGIALAYEKVRDFLKIDKSEIPPLMHPKADDILKSRNVESNEKGAYYVPALLTALPTADRVFDLDPSDVPSREFTEAFLKCSAEKVVENKKN